MTRIDRAVEPRGHGSGELVQRPRRKDELPGLRGILVLIPAELTRHAGLDPVGRHEMPVVVEAEHGHVVRGNEIPFQAEGRVVLQRSQACRNANKTWARA